MAPQDTKDLQAKLKFSQSIKEEKTGFHRKGSNLSNLLSGSLSWLIIPKNTVFVYILVYVTVCSYICFRILLQSCNKEISVAHSVLITLLSSTFGTVVSLFMILARHYFPKNSNFNNDADEKRKLAVGVSTASNENRDG